MPKEKKDNTSLTKYTISLEYANQLAKYLKSPIVDSYLQKGAYFYDNFKLGNFDFEKLLRLNLTEFSQRYIIPHIQNEYSKSNSIEIIAVKIIEFSKIFKHDYHGYVFKLDNDSEIEIALNSINADILDKETINKIDFLIQKFNTNSYLYLSKQCKEGYCDKNCDNYYICQNPKNKNNRNSELKIMGVTDQDRNGMIENNLYFVMKDNVTFRAAFLRTDNNEKIVYVLKQLIRDFEDHYGVNNS